MNYYVIWGGSWVNDPAYCRVANRDSFTPGLRFSGLGFRLIKKTKL